MRRSAIVFLLFLAACSAQSPSTSEDSVAPPSRAATIAPSVKELTVGPKSAALAYMVAVHSPLLTTEQRDAISQDFHGAPLNSEPSMHNVTADRVSCTASGDGVGEEARCSIDYGADVKDIAGEDATFLLAALATAGAEPKSGAQNLERSIMELVCTVDDKVAQGTSSTGDEVNGFACSFTVE